jgi:hypothetical protein
MPIGLYLIPNRQGYFLGVASRLVKDTFFGSSRRVCFNTGTEHAVTYADRFISHPKSPRILSWARLSPRQGYFLRLASRRVCFNTGTAHRKCVSLVSDAVNNVRQSRVGRSWPHSSKTEHIISKQPLWPKSSGQQNFLSVVGQTNRQKVLYCWPEKS